MAVVSVEHLAESRRVDFRAGGRSASETYLVACDQPDDGPYVAVIEGQQFDGPTRLPFLGNQHPIDPHNICVGIEPELDSKGGPFVFRVNVRYETTRGDTAPAADADPLAVPPDFEWGFVEDSRVVETDVGNGPEFPPLPVVTSAGERFDPPLEESLSFPTLVVERNEASDRTALALEYMSPRKAINSDPWSVFGFTVQPGQARIQSLTSRYTRGRAGTGGIFLRYFRVRYEFVMAPDFDVYLLDRGTQFISFPSEPPKTIVDKDGEPLRSPSLLDGTGKVLEPGAPHVFAGPFYLHPRKPFSVFNLPANIP